MCGKAKRKKQGLYPQKLGRKTGCLLQRGKYWSGEYLSRKGQPLNRSNIWGEMKQLPNSKVGGRESIFHIICVTCLHVPIIKLVVFVYIADVWGTGTVDTTRIYTSISIKEHEKYGGSGINFLELNTI